MKKIILSLTVAAAILSSSFTYAATKEPGFKVRQAFSTEFTQAKDVEWTVMNKEGVYQAKFVFNNETLQAFFTEEGDFLGTTRQISQSQLPILVAAGLNKDYADARVVTIFEYSKKDGTEYYITLVTKKGAIIVKATGSGELTVHQRNVK